MRPAPATSSATRPFMRRAIVLLLLASLLAAAGLTFSTLRDIDPRGRASWSGTATVVDAAPIELTIFAPACEIHAVTLHPAANATGWLSIEYLRPMRDAAGEVASTWVAAETVPVGNARPVPLTRLERAADWREPVTLRMRVVGRDGVPHRNLQAIPLDAERPVSIQPAGGSLLGSFACAFDGGSATRAWVVVAATLAVLVGSGLLGAAWLVRSLLGGDMGRPVPQRVPGTRPICSIWLPIFLTGATTLTYALVVPPFEPPDELAHFQYARYIATTGTLPSAVPPPGNEWRASSYEWVQQPLYYIGAAAVLKATGLDTPGPSLVLNPRSRLQPGGTEPSIFQHGAAPLPPTGHRGIGLLRLISLLMAVGTALAIARLVSIVTDDQLVAATVAGGLGLIPQWCAVMGAVSTDPPATLLSALATLAIARVALGRTRGGWLLLTGVSVGAAYAVKATAVFLVPMAVLACAIAPPRPRRPGRAGMGRVVMQVLRSVLIVGVGILLVAGWIHVRAWIVFDDPQAYAFKKAVLEAGGFVPARGPMPWHPEFWGQMRVMVFEPFWARFGSLGAGPFPGTRLWLVYAAASLLLLSLAGAGVLGTSLAGLRQVRSGEPGGDDARRGLPVALCLVGICVGLAAWVAVNLAPRADMVVHWTPRHILPLTAPAAVLVAAGLVHVRRSRVQRIGALVVGLTITALALAWLGVLRATVLTFHFGY